MLQELINNEIFKTRAGSAANLFIEVNTKTGQVSAVDFGGDKWNTIVKPENIQKCLDIIFK